MIPFLPIRFSFLLYFYIERFPVFLPDPFQPRSYLSAAFSPAGYAKCILFCRVSAWAGYEVVKVR
ncbi:hypothetical protein D3Z60_20915 [Lachnospiraceae bacterium]|nr:hypothetical protein [Lachnospiraceae bacterium]